MREEWNIKMYFAYEKREKVWIFWEIVNDLFCETFFLGNREIIHYLNVIQNIITIRDINIHTVTRGAGLSGEWVSRVEQITIREKVLW